MKRGYTRFGRNHALLSLCLGNGDHFLLPPENFTGDIVPFGLEVTRIAWDCISLSIPRLLSLTLKTTLLSPRCLIRVRPFSIIYLALPDESTGLALRERLTRHHVVMTPIMDQDDIWNLAFFDNKGLVLEAA